MLMIGQRLAERDERGAPIEDDDLLLLVNAAEEPVDFKLPGGNWHLLLDTATPGAGVTDPYPLGARALALLAKRK
jgi:pullulanase/glycogen debranching enzyme